ncbi:MFS general substrate transporter [Mycena sanguinolenta]|uniref:MFS general substrate transporter n=1 Tax=Mycena sanguinolenta TaxID=230812 RepID=A0A8H7CTB8_9AGAR|nr:MFS general substrate transporter [Mycena sanguinolenta]
MEGPPVPLGDEASECTAQPNNVSANVSDEGLPKAEFAPLAVTSPMFPDGGLRAWATVAGAFLIQFCGFGYTTSFGVYQDFYTRDYLAQSSSSAISWIGSINAFIVISGGLISGRLFDKGYFRFLVYGGCLLQSFSLFMLSLCKREQIYQIFLAQGVGLGLGAGMVYIPSVAVVSHHFKNRRALAMTIVASGSSLGATVHPIMLNNTFDSLGFPNAVRASAGLITGLLIFACLLMHPRLPPATTHPSIAKALPRFARDAPYVFAILAMSTYTIGFYFPLFYLQLDAVTHGISKTLSFYSLVIMNASSFFGRLSPRVLFLILCMIALKSVASVVVIGVLYGYSAGIFVTLMAPLLTVLTDDLGELGLRMGVGFAVVGIGGLIGPPINGALLTGHFVWWRPALFSGIMAFVGFTFFGATLLALRRKTRRVVVMNEKGGPAQPA